MAKRPDTSFDPNSRYYGVDTAQYTPEFGPPIRYLLVPPRPQGSSFTSQKMVRVTATDRPDTLAATYLGDPTMGWRLADANNELSELDLIQPGTDIRIPLPKATTS